jgi:hypothetical protein
MFAACCILLIPALIRNVRHQFVELDFPQK